MLFLNMSLHRSNNLTVKNSVDYKARLERKLYLARENNEPIFDLSDCNLKSVPKNIFSLCKVFRKETLYLQNNKLSTFNEGGSLNELCSLKVLNIMSNKFACLPPEIANFHNLEVLDVSWNHLKKLPPEISSLQFLKTLNASHNKLKSLPDGIGNCKRLETIDVTFNEGLKNLPVSMGRLKYLKELNIDPIIVYPPKEICENGTSCVLEFLRQELLELNDFGNSSTCSRIQVPRDKSSKMTSFQNELKRLDKYKQEKQIERLEIERKLINDNLKELELHQKSKTDKNKLLEDIKQKQEALDGKILKIQKQKRMERAALLNICQTEEKNSLEAVKKILNNNKVLKTAFLDGQTKERLEEEERLLLYVASENMKNSSSRRKILELMDETMKAEIKKYQSIVTEKHSIAYMSLAAETALQNEDLSELVKKIDKNQSHLVESLLVNEELQKSAVASLLEKSDAISWKLARQIAVIETKLEKLTQLELSKRKIANKIHINELSKNRIALTELLVKIFEEQRTRRNELIEKIRRMEVAREAIQDAENFWMEQYDQLLHSKSLEMVNYLNSLSSNLVYEFFVYGVFQYLPLLKDVAPTTKDLENINVSNLTQLGVQNTEDKENILHAIKSFLTLEATLLKIPSAPQSEEPSAPLLENYEHDLNINYTVDNECVICLDAKPDIIFVPCGHICCCCKCFKSIILCPICRRSIEQSHELVINA